jgi:hypothetical protein
MGGDKADTHSIASLLRLLLFMSLVLWFGGIVYVPQLQHGRQ